MSTLEQITKAELENLSWNSIMLRLLENEPLGNDFIDVLLKIGEMYGGDGWYKGFAGTLHHLPLNKTTEAEIDGRLSKILAESERELKRRRDSGLFFHYDVAGNTIDPQKWVEEELQHQKDYLETERQKELGELRRRESLTELLRGNYTQRLAGSFAGRPMAQDFVQLISDVVNADKYDGDKRNDLYSKIPSLILESAPHLAPNTKLPNALFHSLYAGNHKPQIDALIDNPEVPIALKEEIAKGLLKYEAGDMGWLETIMKAYHILDEKIGKEMKERIFPLFLQGILDESTFNQYSQDLERLYQKQPAYSQDLERLYQKQPAETQNEKPKGILSRARSYLSRLVNRTTSQIDLSQTTSQDLSGQNEQNAKKRVELMRGIAGILREVCLPDYRKEGIEELVRNHPEHKNEEEIWKRGEVLSELQLGREPNKISTFLSEAPLSTLERHLSDLTQLRNVPGFVYDSYEMRKTKDFIPPYEMAGRTIAMVFRDKRGQLLDYLKRAKPDNRVAREVLDGITSHLGANFSYLSQSQSPQEDLEAVMKWINTVDNTTFITYNEYNQINSVEKLKSLTQILARYPSYVREMILAERLGSLMIERGVIDMDMTLTEDGNVRLMWRNPPENIKWYVVEYFYKQLGELAREHLMGKSYYRESSSSEQESMLAQVKKQFIDERQFPDTKDDLEIVLRRGGAYVNGAKYDWKKTHHFDPVKELVERVREYADPFVNTVVTAPEYTENNGEYGDLVDRIRRVLRNDGIRVIAPTHLVYTSLARPRDGRGTHYIVALDRTGNNRIFAIAVNGNNLSVTPDADRYGGEVNSYALLRRDNNRYTPVSEQEMLNQLVQPPVTFAKDVITSTVGERR